VDFICGEVALAAETFHCFRVDPKPPGSFQDTVIIFQNRHTNPTLSYIRPVHVQTKYCFVKAIIKRMSVIVNILHGKSASGFFAGWLVMDGCKLPLYWIRDRSNGSMLY
jgi:hypothetical protein